MENQEKEKSESKKAGIKIHMDYNPGHTKTNKEETVKREHRRKKTENLNPDEIQISDKFYVCIHFNK